MRQISNCVLFDLDGTLTPARKMITKDNSEALKTLLRVARVGILTGSELSFVEEQIGKELLSSGIEVFPCNGTKHFVWSHMTNRYSLMSEAEQMQTFLGKTNYNFLAKMLLNFQLDIMNQYDLPYKGTFLTYRGSLVNWSPIGRDASHEDRSQFEALDQKNGIRRKYYSMIKEAFKKSESLGKLDVKIAGATSFDIYPYGYDKTYVLNYFDQENVNVWFVGDRCSEGGNDKEIYEKLLPSERSFCVSSFEETPSIAALIYDKIMNR